MSLKTHGPFPGGGGGVTVWSEPSHIILKLGGYTLDHISEKVLRGLCDIRMPRHFEPGLVCICTHSPPTLVFLLFSDPSMFQQPVHVRNPELGPAAHVGSIGVRVPVNVTAATADAQWVETV